MQKNKNERSPYLQVFLCHAHEDKDRVLALYNRLLKSGIKPWLDKHDLLPGQDWDKEIPKAVRDSDVVIACLSQHVAVKAGYVQKEITLALDVAECQPEGVISIIPLRLEACEVPNRLYRWHWCDYFEDNGYDLLLRALRKRANQLGLVLEETTAPPPQPPVATPKPAPTPGLPDAGAYFNSAYAYAEKGEYDRAIADYDRAIQLKPDYAAYHNRGLAYQNKGEYDRAIADYDRAIELKPDYANAYVGRGRGLAYYNKGEYDRAIADYDRAIELNPDYALAKNNRDIAIRKKGETE